MFDRLRVTAPILSQDTRSSVASTRVPVLDKGVQTTASNRLKQPRYSFDLTEDGIVKNGELYRREDIPDIFIDNRNLKGSTLAAGSFITAAHGNQANQRLGHLMTAADAAGAGLIVGSASLGAKVNYRVNMRHGKRVVRLATSLDEETAIELFSFLTGEV